MPTIQETAEEALSFLSETDEEYARAKARMEGLRHILKSVLAQQTLESAEKSAALKKADAECSQPYLKVVEDYENSVLDFETLKAKRTTHTMRFEYFRSVNSAKKAGVVN